MTNVTPVIEFQPTPSARRVTTPRPASSAMRSISTHTLRKEGDYGLQFLDHFGKISTHTLRKEGD